MAWRIDPEGVETCALAQLARVDDLRVLELGCGNGRLTFRYAANAACVLAVDPDTERITEAREALTSVLADTVTFAVSSAELTNKVNETLVPKLNELPGFVGYYLIEAGHGVFSSLSLFETREQAMESTKFVATWIREEKLDTILPTEPTITSGQVVAHSDRVLVAA